MDQGFSAKTPMISVVMCVYNTMPYIKAAVDSVLNQTYKNWELIISDDGSTDGSREWLKRFEGHPQVRLFFQEKNIGYVANKNFAISQALGEYITQNDSDDVSDLTRLEKQVAVCNANPDVKIVACGYHKTDNTGQVYNSIHLQEDQLIKKYSGQPYPFWFPPLLVHREVYKKVGLYTSYFVGMGDDLYWTAKANEKYIIYCLKDVLYSYKDNPGSITNVLNDNRKLIVTELLSKILRERSLTGTDRLENRDFAALREMEDDMLKDKKFMSESYRIWAAKAIDKRNWDDAKILLKTAFYKNPLNEACYRTMFYFMRQKLFNS